MWIAWLRQHVQVRKGLPRTAGGLKVFPGELASDPPTKKYQDP